MITSGLSITKQLIWHFLSDIHVWSKMVLPSSASCYIPGYSGQFSSVDPCCSLLVESCDFPDLLTRFSKSYCKHNKVHLLKTYWRIIIKRTEGWVFFLVTIQVVNILLSTSKKELIIMVGKGNSIGCSSTWYCRRAATYSLFLLKIPQYNTTK